MKVVAYTTFEKVFEQVLHGNRYGWHLDAHSATEMYDAGAAALLNEEQTAGLILWPDGEDVEVRSLFNVGPSGDGRKILDQATRQFGATVLNAYDGPLMDIYKPLGWYETGREWFDTKYANERWSHSHGYPDVVFMRHERDPQASLFLPLTILNEPMPIPDGVA